MGKKGVPEWLNSSLWSSSSPSPGPTPRPRPPPPPPPPDLVADRLYRSDDAAPRSQHQSAKRQEDGEKEASLAAPARPQASPNPPPPSAPVDSAGKDRDPSRLSPEEVSRQSQLLSELSKKVVNVGELRRLALLGVPDGAGIRSTLWKLLLGYLPNDRSLWISELSKKRSQYNAFKEELLMNPSEITRRLGESSSVKNEDAACDGSGLLHRQDIVQGEHPLSLGKSSVWNKFFQESEIVEQIDRDVKRTHPDMNFFSGGTSLAKSNREALKRILMIFSKLNPGIRYVQGMNEVLAPLFYVFRNDPDNNSALLAEPDTFFCFVELLSGFRDNFCQQLDNSVVGIRSTIARLSQLLKRHDEELWRHLEITTKVNPQFYAFRWITLLLTQEFNFAECLHIWDTLLSDPEGPQETLLRVCCAMLILVRRRLLAGDFTSNLKLLQGYPSTNIGHLLYVANKLRGALPD